MGKAGTPDHAGGAKLDRWLETRLAESHGRCLCCTWRVTIRFLFGCRRLFLQSITCYPMLLLHKYIYIYIYVYMYKHVYIIHSVYNIYSVVYSIYIYSL